MTRPRDIRVLVVDDHPVVRAGLRALLETKPGILVVGEAADGVAAVRGAEADRPDVVLCDLRLGEGLDGVAVTKALRHLADQPPQVVILTTYDHDADIVRAVEAGAAGYLLKDAAPDDIVSAIARAHAGETVLDADLSRRVIDTMRTRRAGLSGREVEVLQLVAAGRSNKDVSKELFITEATVKSHLYHAFAKLGVDSRTAAVAAARTAGLLD
ncbi:response regulator transcription factor [Intrasporangium sp.]|uniref:response regulator transcription factor n=1 Tax=Intrasporangium sp. TaxID=1925024 RepID=UPI0029398EEB|nr:response regulator transcription factor [Intrasporangium sp.]MDV3223322.1 response regulator transcription factor [Intrasporangium sp.]